MLFPGYIFCCFDASAPLPVLIMPNVVGIVCCGRTPEPIDQMEMRAVQRLAASGLVSEPHRYLKRLARASVFVRAPLEGVEGLLLGPTPRPLGSLRVVAAAVCHRRSGVPVGRARYTPGRVRRVRYEAEMFLSGHRIAISVLTV